MSGQDEAMIRRFFEEAWGKGNVDVVDELCSNDHVTYDPAAGPQRNRQGAKQLISAFRHAFPDASLTIEDQISAGDKVVTRWTARGTHRGELRGIGPQGIEPTGKQIVVEGIQIDEVVDGKVVRSWVQWDVMGMMRQVGRVPPGQSSAA